MVDSVFGKGCPQFIVGATTVSLYYSVLDAKWSEKEQKLFASPISASGDRTYKVRGKYATFQVGIHLHKYDTNPAGYVGLSSAYDTAQLLLSLEDQDGTFYPFTTGWTPYGAQPIKDSSDNIVPCRLFDIQPDFLEKAGGKFDYWTLTFLTNKFYDMSKLLPG